MWKYNYLISDELCHHGIKGQKWGVKHGPPYPIGGEDYYIDKKRRHYKQNKSIRDAYNKKHIDKIIKKGTTLATLSYDKDRTKGSDMFFSAYNKADRAQYEALFNKKVTDIVYKKNGKIEKRSYLKYRITHQALKDLKVASEDTGADVFMRLYKKDRDFCNYVKDPNRLLKNIDERAYRFNSYNKSKEVLNKISNKTASEKDLRTIYKLFNYQIPAEGKDSLTQRSKFFKELKKEGYSAVLDTNDTLYGGYKTTASVIVFDMDSVLLNKDIRRVTMTEKRFAQLSYFGRKYLGIGD